MANFKINGRERKKLKSELSRAKFYVKNFWQFYFMNRDLTEVYGGYFQSEDEAKATLENEIARINEIEEQLNETV